MSLLEAQVGPKTLENGATDSLRLDKEGRLVTTGGGGAFAEATRRGLAYVISNPLAGETAAAAHLSPPAAAAATLLTLYNPQNSGKVAIIHRVTGDFISGTVEVGTYSWCFHGSASISATPNAIHNACLVDGTVAVGHKGTMYGFSNTALTGGLLAIQGPPIGMWATAGTQRFETIIDGAIVVPEGCAATIGAPTNATSTVSRWAIWYYEALA